MFNKPPPTLFWTAREGWGGGSVGCWLEPWVHSLQLVHIWAINNITYREAEWWNSSIMLRCFRLWVELFYHALKYKWYTAWNGVYNRVEVKRCYNKEIMLNRYKLLINSHCHWHYFIDKLNIYCTVWVQYSGRKGLSNSNRFTDV